MGSCGSLHRQQKPKCALSHIIILDLFISSLYYILRCRLACLIAYRGHENFNIESRILYKYVKFSIEDAKSSVNNQIFSFDYLVKLANERDGASGMMPAAYLDLGARNDALRHITTLVVA